MRAAPEGKTNTKLKICGLTRPCDIDWVNEARPDFCGFILNVPKSRRNITIPTLYALRLRLADGIIPTGVFVDAAAETILPLVRDGTLGAVQLHGNESPEFIRKLREEMCKTQTVVPIIKAFRITGVQSLNAALESPADLVLLDNGAGGTGKTFDWSLLAAPAAFPRPYLLAGGLGPDNIEDAIRALHPWGLDMSSGVETDRKKDRDKILAAAAAVRRYQI